MSARSDSPETTAALASIAWLVVFNKPFYPLYVWWIAGHGLAWACLTALSAPLFAAVALLARRDPTWLLAGLPILGALDTAFATKLFGEASGAQLFLAACALLVVAARPARAWITWVCAGVLFVLVAGLHGRYGDPLYQWSEAELARLLTLNVFSVAGLGFFILVRFSRIRA